MSLCAAGAGVPLRSSTSTSPGKPASWRDPVRDGDDPFGQSLDSHRRDQHLAAIGGVAQPRCHVHGGADVVVTLEQQGVPAGDPGAHRQRRADIGRALTQVEGEGDRLGLIDGDDHAAVAEPLGDAHAALGGDLANDRPEGAEQATGGIVAEHAGVVGESGQVDEHERAGDTHSLQARGRAGRPTGTVESVSLRYTYSRWDGTQRGFEPDADDVLAAITDDLIEHGDVNAALRRLMNDGLRGRRW